MNLADNEPLLASMREAGFHRVFLGIETPVEESLKEAQKSQNRGNLLESVRKIQSRGMEVMAGFIVGFDNDPEDIFERQIAFIRERAEILEETFEGEDAFYRVRLSKKDLGALKGMLV